MILPLGLKSLSHSALGLGIDEVNPHNFGLKESLQAVDRLDKVIELVADAQIYGP